MTQMTAQGHKEVEGADGTKIEVRPPMELQLGWLMRRWGTGVLGTPPSYRLLIRADRALHVYDAFKKEMKDRTREDWQVVSRTVESSEKLLGRR